METIWKLSTQGSWLSSKCAGYSRHVGISHRSDTGWGCHFHTVLVFPENAERERIDSIGSALIERWLRYSSLVGFDALPGGQDWEMITDSSAATHYASHQYWNHPGQAEGHTPEDIHREAASGDLLHTALWWELEAASRNRRWANSGAFRDERIRRRQQDAEQASIRRKERSAD